MLPVPAAAGQAQHRMELVGATTAMGIQQMLYSCIPGRILQRHRGSAVWTRQAGGYGQHAGQHPTRHSLRSGSPSPEIFPLGHAQEGELPEDAN